MNRLADVLKIENGEIKPRNPRTILVCTHCESEVEERWSGAEYWHYCRTCERVNPDVREEETN